MPEFLNGASKTEPFMVEPLEIDNMPLFEIELIVVVPDVAIYSPLSVITNELNV